MSNYKEKKSTPIWHKPFLTVNEAIDYFGMCEDKIKELTGGDENPFVLWNGTKRLIKRIPLEEHLTEAYSI